MADGPSDNLFFLAYIFIRNMDLTSWKYHSYPCRENPRSSRVHNFGDGGSPFVQGSGSLRVIIRERV